jgi:hypothetical protein
MFSPTSLKHPLTLASKYQCLQVVSNTLCPQHIPIKRSRWVISSERGGHGVRPSLPIHRYGKVEPKNWRTSNPSVAVHHPNEEPPMAETLLTEVQHKAPPYPGKRLLKLFTQNGPLKLCIRAQQTFTLGRLSLSFSKTTRGFSKLQMRTLCLFTFPEVWKVASSKNKHA